MNGSCGRYRTTPLRLALAHCALTGSPIRSPTAGLHEEESHMVRVVGIDHLVIRVSDYERSKAFYCRLFDFLGFEISDEYEDAIGWTNGDVGYHHYAFQLRSRKDVDALQAFLEETGTVIVDPAGEYYDDYYAVFFLDPDGLKLEGMKYGERHAQAARKRAAKTRKSRAKKR
jgi:catechol-2,3-dioxygenase